MVFFFDFIFCCSNAGRYRKKVLQEIPAACRLFCLLLLKRKFHFMKLRLLPLVNPLLYIDIIEIIEQSHRNLVQLRTVNGVI